MLSTWWDTLEAPCDEAIIPGYNSWSEYNVTRTSIFACTFKAWMRHDVKQMVHNRIKIETFYHFVKGMLDDCVRDENVP
jgi:hypothetical protein